MFDVKMVILAHVPVGFLTLHEGEWNLSWLVAGAYMAAGVSLLPPPARQGQRRRARLRSHPRVARRTQKLIICMIDVEFKKEKPTHCRVDISAHLATTVQIACEVNLHKKILLQFWALIA